MSGGIPSASAKKAAAAQKEMEEYFTAQIQEIAAERDAANERTAMLEQRIAEMEQQHVALEKHMEQALAQQQERAAAREQQLLDEAKLAAEKSQSSERAASAREANLESDKAAQASRLEEISGRVAQLEEQAREVAVQRDRAEEKASALAEKLAQTEAEKRGIEALGEQSTRALELQLSATSKSSREAQLELHARIEAAEAKLPPVVAQRDEEAAERLKLAAALATAQAEGVALRERIPPLERRLKEDVERLEARLEAAEGARDEAARRREETIAEVPPLHAKIAELSAERAALAALVPQLEKRLGDEQAAERERTDVHIRRAEQHTTEAKAERDAAQREAARLRGEIETARQAKLASEAALRDKLEHLQVELAGWAPKLEASEARVVSLKGELEKASGHGHTQGVEVAALRAEAASLRELVRRTEAWGEAQAKELKEGVAQAHMRLEAAAVERIAILEQKEAATVAWHAAQEALAACQAEKRAAEAAVAPVERALSASEARVSRLEIELRELGVSAKSACRRVEELQAMHTHALAVEKGLDDKVERERGRLALALTDERERSQNFVEATFAQQQKLVEQQQQQLDAQRWRQEEGRRQEEELQRSRAVAELEERHAARLASASAAAIADKAAYASVVAGREQQPLLISALAPAPSAADEDDPPGGGKAAAAAAVAAVAVRAGVSSRSLAEINQLLDLQSSIRDSAMELQTSLRHKHVEQVVGGPPGGASPPSTSAAAPEARDPRLVAAGLGLGGI